MKRVRHASTRRTSARTRLHGLVALAAGARIARALRGERSGFVKVLLYHDVPLASRRNLRLQLETIRDRYGFIEPREFEKIARDAEDVTGIRVLLTFDDGLKSNKIVADEILAPLGIKAAFFVPGVLPCLQDDLKRRRYIAGRVFRRATVADLPPDLTLMDKDDLRQLAAQGHLIGSHGQSHCRLSQIQDAEQLREEIIGSGNTLERELGSPVTWFAYPFGDVRSVDIRAYAVIGERYDYCFSGVRGVNRRGFCPRAILRDPANPAWPVGYLRFYVEDGAGLLYRRDATRLNRMANA